MAMQTDVKAATRTTSGLFIGGRHRIKGMYITSPVGSSGFIDVIDSLTLTGTAKLSFDLASGDTVSMRFPGEGVLFETGVYLSISGENTPTVTIFYG